MFTKIMKWISVLVLFLAVIWPANDNLKLALQSIICVAGLLVMVQALRTGKYLWAIGFVAIAVLFNPVVPVNLGAPAGLLMDLACAGAFLGSLAALKTRPVLSFPSITGRRAIIEAL